MRLLSNIEQAFTQSNAAYPLSVVCAIKLQHGPSPEALKFTFNRLQEKYPLFRAVIKKEKNHFRFVQLKNQTPILIQNIPRINEHQWQKIVRLNLNKTFDHENAPLMKVIYLIPAAGEFSSEIIFVFHHAIIDSTSLVLLINELLENAANFDINENKIMANEAHHALPPSLDTILPPPFKGIRLPFHLLPFIFRQIADEFKYRKTTKKIKDSVIPTSSENDILTISFSKATTTVLIKWARKKRLTLNAILSAAILLVVHRHRYASQKHLLRTIQFANLRPYLHPPVSSIPTGCYISMLRFTVPLNPDSTLEEVSEYLNIKYKVAAKRGDKFLFAKLSKMLVRQTLKKHNKRLGATALSYAGSLALKENYGNIVVSDIHGFITNNCLGPEFTGFGKICFGQLSLDMNFLTAEINMETASSMANEIKLLIEQQIIT